MSLLVLFCHELVPVIRVLILNADSNKNAIEKDWLQSIILNHSKRCGSKHMYEPAYLSYECTLLGNPWKLLIVKKLSLISSGEEMSHL